MAQEQQAHIAELNARIDRLPRWGLNTFAFLVLAIGWFFIFYDLTVIGFTLPVLVQTFHLTGTESALPVSANLFAYMIGAYALGSWADYVGRRRAFQWSLGIMGVGAILTALSWNLASLTIFRGLTGLGMGAAISLATALLTELSPAASRGKNVAYNLIAGGIGLSGSAFIAIPLVGVPAIGWRIAFLVGALALVVLAFLRDPWFPESPRWLVLHGRTADADRIVAAMEQRVQARVGTLPPVQVVPSEGALEEFPTLTLFKPPYLGRTVSVLLFWIAWYIWIYAYLSFGPTILIKMGLSEPHGFWYSALGDVAFPLGALLAALVTDRVHRKYLIAVASLIVVLGFVLIGTSSGTAATVVIGGALIGLGNLGGVGMAYTYTAEIFPTRARASGMAIGDGIGHLGGAIQPFIVLAALSAWGAAGTLWLLAGFVVVDIIIILAAGRRTTREALTRLAS